MTALLDRSPADPAETPRSGRGGNEIVVDVVVPVHNEERDLGPGVRRLHAYLCASFPFTWRITIADNASTDATPAVAAGLVEELPGVRVVRLERKGRGRALSHVWLGADSCVVAYMDVDLSTDLSALLPLVAPLVTGHSDVAIGSRLSRTSRVVRGPRREIISRCYNLLLRAVLGVRFADAQCGFKAMRTDRARVLLPHVRDTGWFWDTELLVLAERTGLRIHEVPVDWIDDTDSRVDVVATAISDLKGIARLGRGLVTGALPLAQLRAAMGEAAGAGPGDVPPGLVRRIARFAVVGAVSTLAYTVLYLLLRPAVGAQAGNALALLVTAVANTAANRRFTFSWRGREQAVRHQVEGLVIFAMGLALTGGGLVALHAVDPAPSRVVEVIVLAAANLAATVLRFVLLAAWVFHPARRRTAAVDADMARSRA